ncbi:hypothetical protein CCY99_09110 [Helicobacter sp. 16-1353]|nr:hypothetical protein CCY99_09110 [Helicobacter sp. 16-1353]
MQPYFLPYIGYFQLINAVDSFVIYDNIEYSKKSWVNRNRFLQNNKDCLFSLPLRKDSDFLHIDKRYLSDSFNPSKILDSLHFAYRKAPHYNSLMPLLESIFSYPRENLFDFIYHSILLICRYLEIKSNIFISSCIDINHSLKSKDKVISICKALNATSYINPIGGIGLYFNDDFKRENINLRFLETNGNLIYRQFENDFVPNLSIIDIIAFNDIAQIKQLLLQYKLIDSIKNAENSAMGGGSRYYLIIFLYDYYRLITLTLLFYIFYHSINSINLTTRTNYAR